MEGVKKGLRRGSNEQFLFVLLSGGEFTDLVVLNLKGTTKTFLEI